MLVDAKSPNPGFERLPGKAQPDCCSGGTGHSPLRGCQGGLDALSLVSWPCAGGCDRRSEGAVRIPPQPCLIHGEHLSIREDDRALDDVLKLADIPGPVIGSKQLERPSIDAPDLLAGLLGKALDQILDEQRDVVGSVAERGDFDGKDIQPVVKVLAELSLRDGALQVAIACG